jgi:hypothetical protein
MHDTKERLSCCGSSRFSTTCMRTFWPCGPFLAYSIQRTPHLPQWVLMGSAVLMEMTHRHDCGVSAAYV